MTASEDAGDALVIGGVGVLWFWTTLLLKEACGRADPMVETREMSRDEDVGEIGGAGPLKRVLIARHPDMNVMAALQGRTVPVVVVIDDPVDCTRCTMEAQACSAEIALRSQTASAAAHHLLPGHPLCLLLRRGTEASARVVATAVLAHVNVVLPPEHREAVLEALCGPLEEDRVLEGALQRVVAAYRPLNSLADVVLADDNAVIRTVLSPLISGAIFRDIGPVVWPARTLLFGDRPNEMPPTVVDLAGSPRIIYYGPYYHLPPGRWNVTFLIAFTNEVRGHSFYLDVLVELKPIARVEITPTDGGTFEGRFVLEHKWAEQSVEINLVSLEGMIEGQIALKQIGFTRSHEVAEHLRVAEQSRG